MFRDPYFLIGLTLGLIASVFIIDYGMQNPYRAPSHQVRINVK